MGTINQKLKWGHIKTDIVHDIDGTFSGKAVESYVTPTLPHLSGHSNCEESTTDYDVPTLICDGTTQIRQVQFFSMTPSSLFLSSPLKIARIDPSTNKNMTELNSTSQVTTQSFDSDIYYGSKIAKSQTSENKNIGMSEERSAK